MSRVFDHRFLRKAALCHTPLSTTGIIRLNFNINVEHDEPTCRSSLRWLQRGPVRLLVNAECNHAECLQTMLRLALLLPLLLAHGMAPPQKPYEQLSPASKRLQDRRVCLGLSEYPVCLSICLSIPAACPLAAAGPRGPTGSRVRDRGACTTTTRRAMRGTAMRGTAMRGCRGAWPEQSLTKSVVWMATCWPCRPTAPHPGHAL